MAIDLNAPGANTAALRTALATILNEAGYPFPAVSAAKKKILDLTKTPYDYGAVANGVIGTPASGTDASEGLQGVLDEAFGTNGNGFADLQGGIYRVTAPVVATIDGNRFAKFGVRGNGAVIVSAIGNTAQDVFTINCASASGVQVRHLLVDEICIIGQGGVTPVERDGLVISCADGSDGAIYSFSIREVAIESCGRHNMNITGDVFEGQIWGGSVRGAGTSGIAIANGTGGSVVSSLGIIGVNVAMNRGVGINVATPCNDVYCLRCDFISNGDYGWSSSNGCRVQIGCHYENNHDLKGSQADQQAAINSPWGVLIGCYGVQNNSKQKHLLRTVLTNDQTMIDCHSSGTNHTLFYVSGPTAGRWLRIIGCMGTRGTLNGALFSDNGVVMPVARTTNLTLSGSESSTNYNGAVFTNEGCTARVDFTLPSAAAGNEFEFVVQDADGIRVIAATGDTIKIGGAAETATGGNVTSTAIGSTLRLVSINATQWFAKYSLGTWA